jgi:hypothetical protein
MVSRGEESLPDVARRRGAVASSTRPVCTHQVPPYLFTCRTMLTVWTWFPSVAVITQVSDVEVVPLPLLELLLHATSHPPQSTIRTRNAQAVVGLHCGVSARLIPRPTRRIAAMNDNSSQPGPEGGRSFRRTGNTPLAVMIENVTVTVCAPLFWGMDSVVARIGWAGSLN